MERVTGIGGFFFPAKDPTALRAWYADRLGVDPPPAAEGEEPWMQAAGPTAFAPADVGAEHLSGRAWAINFRVRDLDAMVEQLRANGVDVRVHEEEYSYGRFADLADPEGNPIQLWQPSDDEPV
jgi:predicted enzyme related to lactoylglutathione lyase